LKKKRISLQLLYDLLFDRFRDRLPKEFTFERELLRSRLWRSPDRWELAHE
jgi:phosphoenolpyruvate carboxykinase (GTP)